MLVCTLHTARWPVCFDRFFYTFHFFAPDAAWPAGAWLADLLYEHSGGPTPYLGTVSLRKGLAKGPATGLTKRPGDIQISKEWEFVWEFNSKEFDFADKHCRASHEPVHYLHSVQWSSRVSSYTVVSDKFSSPTNQRKSSSTVRAVCSPQYYISMLQYEFVVQSRDPQDLCQCLHHVCISSDIIGTYWN